MDYTRITLCVIVGVTVGVIAYDLLPALNAVDDDTISEQQRIISARWWVLPMAWQVLYAHWWGPLAAPVFKGAGWVMLAVGLGAIALNVFGPRFVAGPLHWHVVGALGYLLGCSLWAVQVGEVEEKEEEGVIKTDEERRKA